MQQNNSISNTEEIEFHIRTYRSLLKASGEVKISQLTESHINMDSILHQKGKTEQVDMAAFIYVLLRLPSCMSNVNQIILGQSYSVFRKHGFLKLSRWIEVDAPGRRRKMFFDGKNYLTAYIASVTDVDDLITLLTAFQIEWNKFHKLIVKSDKIQEYVDQNLDPEDVEKMKKIWGKNYDNFLVAIKNKTIDFTVKLLSGSYVEYAKATKHWWNHAVATFSNLNIAQRPIYLVSSNTHSLINLLTKYALNSQNKLIDYLYHIKDPFLLHIWERIKLGSSPYHKDYFLYYIAKKYAKENKEFEGTKLQFAKTIGIYNLPARHYLDIGIQIIELKKLRDHRLKKSESLIVNIDYPLGWAAYQVLTEIGQNVDNVRGIYIMGKAATLNGKIGDILIPSVVSDQHTRNIYAFTNTFNRRDLSDLFHTGSILENQKTVCVKGTFFENQKMLDLWFKNGYNTIEMETGPYLNAVYEFVYYNRYVESQFINLTSAPFDLGIIHYASDTPYSKAKNLGVRNLSYEGVEATYAISQAILNKIYQKEMSV